MPPDPVAFEGALNGEAQPRARSAGATPEGAGYRQAPKRPTTAASQHASSGADQDRDRPRGQAHRAAARLPDAQALILSGCGHLPHVEDPAAFSRAMVAFLDRADRRTSPARTSG